MSRFLNTLGNPTLAVAICDRCHKKVPYDTLVADYDAPGLRVCRETCVDAVDPYKLPPRQPEKITLRYPRTDEDVAVS